MGSGSSDYEVFFRHVERVHFHLEKLINLEVEEEDFFRISKVCLVWSSWSDLRRVQGFTKGRLNDDDGIVAKRLLVELALPERFH